MEGNYAPEAERSVIGAVLIKPKCLDSLELKPEDFYFPVHRAVYESMLALRSTGQAVDPVTVSEHCRVHSGQDVTGELLSMASDTPTAENVGHYATIVTERSSLRSIASECAQAVSACRDGKDAAESILERLATSLAGIATRRSTGLVRIGDHVALAVAEMEARVVARTTGVVLGVRTGMASLDRILGGLQPGNLCIVAADTGAGKTALAMQACMHLVLKDGGAALACNLEMTASELAERCMVFVARGNSQLARSGEINADQFRLLVAAGQRLAAAPLYLEDCAFTSAALFAKARAWRVLHPKERGLIVLDYVQLMRSVRRDGDSRATEVSQFTRSLKELAKELGVAVIGVSQFNRGPGKDSRRPRKSDLKESSAIEQDADQIVLIWRPNDTEHEGSIDVEFIVEKNRHGPMGIVEGRFTGRYYAFEEI